jgi:hypothetical protein
VFLWRASLQWRYRQLYGCCLKEEWCDVDDVGFSMGHAFVREKNVPGSMSQEGQRRSWLKTSAARASMASVEDEMAHLDLR